MEVSCYNFVAITYEQGFLDPSTDATYIIHLEGNGRYDHIMDQLSKYHPTKLVYILYNKGYKKCKKKLPRELPRYDLTDAFVTCFKHATAQNYNNILILEDDFIFTDLILDPIIHDEVNSFVCDEGDKSFIYLLGSLPIFQIPHTLFHNKLVLSSGTHSIVYSREFIKQTLLTDTSRINDWDKYSLTSFSRYTFYEPLCFQTLPSTENKQSWSDNYFILHLLHFIIYMFKLDKQIEPGHTIFNIGSKLLFYILLIILLYVLLRISRYLCSKR
jgi:hypothetical protein